MEHAYHLQVQSHVQQFSKTLPKLKGGEAGDGDGAQQLGALGFNPWYQEKKKAKTSTITDLDSDTPGIQCSLSHALVV